MANAIHRVNPTLTSSVDWARRLVPVVTAVTLAACLVHATPAAAHPEWSPIRVNRYAKLVFADPALVKLVYTILYGEGPALAARKSVDLDANGKIDDKEKALLGARAATAAQTGLHLELDGHPVALGPPLATDVGLAGVDVSPEPYSVDLTYVIAAAGAHALVVDDRVEVPNEGDSEVSIDDAGAQRVASAHRGRKGAGLEKTFTFRGPRFSVLEDRSVGIELAGAPQPAPVHSDGKTWWPVGLGGAAALAALIVLFMKRRRRR